MSNDLNWQAPWVGDDSLDWEDEEEKERAYDEYIDWIIDEIKEGRTLKGDKV